MTTGVSFVVPVYNKAPYLKDVLAQIKRQRGDFRRHYVFIDDGSTDSSLQQLNELTEMWENVEIVSQVNAGSAAATNRGIEMAREPYIKFVDADDLISTDATACLLRALFQLGQRRCGFSSGHFLAFSRTDFVQLVHWARAIHFSSSDRLV